MGSGVGSFSEYGITSSGWIFSEDYKDSKDGVYSENFVKNGLN